MAPAEAATTLFEQHRAMYQTFAGVYGISALIAWNLLARASKADPHRFTMQQLLLMLVSGLCAGITRGCGRGPNTAGACYLCASGS